MGFVEGENASGALASKAGTPSRVCLIIPPSAFLLDERVFPALGILRLAAVLERDGIPVEVLDLSGVSNYLDICRDYFADNPPPVAGLSVTTPQLPFVIEIVKVIREVAPAVRLLAGGPHITLSYAGARVAREHGIAGGRAAAAVALLEATFDTLCIGDGERAILAAITPDAPKMIDGDNRKSPYFLSNQDYEALPLPARHQIDLASYHYKIEGAPATSLIGQLGCPFSCSFCGGRNSPSLRVVRSRSVDSILREVEWLHRTYNYTGFMFYDDELNVSKSLTELMDQLTALQRRLGVEFHLRGFVKSELFTDAQAAAMRRAGFRWLLCGFEAADPRILLNINKRATVADNCRAVEIAKRNDLKVKALMSVGHPGESEETVAANLKWLVDIKVDDFDCTIISTYPGTPYYDEAEPHADLPGVWTYVQKKTGDRLHAYDVDYSRTSDYYKGIPGGGYRSFVFTDHLDAERLVALRDDLETKARAVLGIPFNPPGAALRYEHSSGGHLPRFVLRRDAVAGMP